MCKTVRAFVVVFSVMLGAATAADVQAELPLPAQLRELDRDYTNGLEALLTEAKLRDDKALIADIEARLAVAKQYRTTAPQEATKTVVITGTMYGMEGSGSGELHMSRRGIQWRDVHGSRGIADLTLNGVEWKPQWKGPRIGWWWDSTEFTSLLIDRVISVEKRGQVTTAKVDRGPGKTVYRITRSGNLKDSEPLSFALRIKYVPPPQAGESEPKEKAGDEF